MARDSAEPRTDDQDEVMAFLTDPQAYDPPPDRVERIDTHGAVVFLAGRHAYKMKRAVKLPYLDFSTLEKRRRVCEHEIARNIATAPDLYLGVAPVVRAGEGRLALGGPGEAVEWLVRMKRFDQAELFDRLADENRLDLALMPPLADRIAAYHGASRPVGGADGREIVARVVAQTVDAFSGASDVLEPGAVRALSGAVEEALAAGTGRLRERADTGFVRLCHGDLHLKNIVLHRGRPTLFDAIEFDDALATIDVLYDLAFLVMDLWSRGLRGQANLVLNRYLSSSGDDRNLRGLSLLPLFQSVRAAVRAMVAIDLPARVEGEARRSARAEIGRYFELAAEFLQPGPVRLIAVGGRSGTGKSTLAARLAPETGKAPGALHVRSDVERKRLLGVGETERLGASGYGKAVTKRVYRRIADVAEMSLAAGHSAVMDAAFLSPEERRMAETVAQGAGAEFTGLWLEAPEAQLITRVETRRNDASDADAEVVKMQAAIDTGPISWNRVGAEGNVETVLADVMQILRRSEHTGP